LGPAGLHVERDLVMGQQPFARAHAIAGRSSVGRCAKGCTAPTA
jgi:hypothetical protein